MKKFLGAAFALALAGTAPDVCADDAALKAHHFPAPPIATSLDASRGTERI